MTSNYSLTGIKAFALGAALSMTAGLALAGDNVISADQITRALQPKPLTRGLSGGTQIDTAAQAKETKFVDSLRNRKSRSLSLGEREEIAQIASAKPSVVVYQITTYDWGSRQDQQAAYRKLLTTVGCWDARRDHAPRRSARHGCPARD